MFTTRFCASCHRAQHVISPVLQLTDQFPDASLRSPWFWCSVAGFVINNASWYWFFFYDFRLYLHPTLYDVHSLHLMGFFEICVWAVPFGFFVGLSVEDNRLPLHGTDLGSTGSGGSSVPSGAALKVSLRAIFRALTPSVITAAKTQQRHGYGHDTIIPDLSGPAPVDQQLSPSAARLRDRNFHAVNKTV